MSALLLRDVEFDGARTNVRVEDGRIAEIGAASAKQADDIACSGGALIPGLIDHHIHLFATAARMDSVELSAARGADDIIAALRAASAARGPSAWVRAINYDDSGAALLSRNQLDLVGAPNPIRVQDRTGALWVLNSAALARILPDAPPDCVELDAQGRATGRIWRGDAWLRTRINAPPPSLAALSRRLAAYGIVGVTDASVTNGPQEAHMLAEARRSGDLMQSLCVMSGGEIPHSPHYEIGPLKILPDERDLPELEEVVARMRMARVLDRQIAVHCVTSAELALTLAAFETVRARPGDRIEHGGVIPQAMIETLRALELSVVTQPHFIYERGDRYRRTIDESEWPDLYRLGSLRAAGAKAAAGSDGPYGGIDPWLAIATAVRRETRAGAELGVAERIGARAALGLYLGDFHTPGGQERRIAAGAQADLCVLNLPLAEALADPRRVSVRAAIARGALIYMSA
jgi:predicted amidohydrolase YtcJ